MRAALSCGYTQPTCVALSTATALQTDFPFQTVHKERFNPLILTKCTNINDAARVPLGNTSVTAGFMWAVDAYFTGTVSCFSNVEEFWALFFFFGFCDDQIWRQKHRIEMKTHLIVVNSKCWVTAPTPAQPSPAHPNPNPQPNSHTHAGTKRPPYQCQRFVQQSFRVHEVSLATMRSIVRPTVEQQQQLGAVVGGGGRAGFGGIKLITSSDLHLWSSSFLHLFLFSAASRVSA